MTHKWSKPTGETTVLVINKGVGGGRVKRYLKLVKTGTVWGYLSDGRRFDLKTNTIEDEYTFPFNRVFPSNAKYQMVLQKRRLWTNLTRSMVGIQEPNMSIGQIRKIARDMGINLME